MLVGIASYRAAVARIVRSERRNYDQPIPGDIDIDVSIFSTAMGFDSAGYSENAESADRTDHRRRAMEARAELWRNIRAGDVSNAEEVQTYEEWSHTE